MPKTLHLTLTYHWWDKIASGEKNAEYRRFTANWRKRLADVRPGDLVVFHRGYTSRVITRRIEQIRVLSGRDLPNEVYQFFGCPNESQFFEIALDNVVNCAII